MTRWGSQAELHAEYGWRPANGSERLRTPWGWVSTSPQSMSVLEPATAARSSKLARGMIESPASPGMFVHIYGVWAALVPLGVVALLGRLGVQGLEPWVYAVGAAVLVAFFVTAAVDRKIIRRTVTGRDHVRMLQQIVELLHDRDHVKAALIHQVLWESAHSHDSALQQLSAARALAQELDRRAEIDADTTTLAAHTRDLAEENRLRQTALHEIERKVDDPCAE